MRVDYWPIENVKPYANNPRVIPDAAVRKLATLIQRIGWRQPIVVDADGEIIVGHARYKAALRLKASMVPVHVADELTPDQVRAYRIADNRTGEETSWVDDLLSAELGLLTGDDGDPSEYLIATGFDDDELDRLLAIAPEPGDPTPPPSGEPAGDDDEWEEAPHGGEQKKLGEVYELIVECEDEATQQAVKELIEGAELSGVVQVRAEEAKGGGTV